MIFLHISKRVNTVKFSGLKEHGSSELKNILMSPSLSTPFQGYSLQQMN